MAKSVFSIAIFLIVFRETLEASIIVSVLLGLVEQLVKRSTGSTPSPTTSATVEVLTSARGFATTVQHNPIGEEKDSAEQAPADTASPISAVDHIRTRLLVKKLRRQIFLGSLLGFVISLSIGAAFIAIWFTKAANLWERSEDLWEGIFSLIACIIIFVMGITMLKMDRAKTKWRVKLQRAFEGRAVDGRTRTGRYILFFLPFVTVLREGMEGVVFVGGVSLGQPATSIPIAAITGIVCGVIVGIIIYSFASRTSLSIFLVVMTNLLLLIGAGLFSKSVQDFQKHAFKKILGPHADDTVLAGDGPGSYDVRGNVWHLNCCNPDHSKAWGIFWALFGWTNSATLGTILAYVFYWIAVIIALIVTKFLEGRTTLLGRESERGRSRRERREEAEKTIEQSANAV